MLILMDGRIKQWSAEASCAPLLFTNVHLFFLSTASRVILISLSKRSLSGVSGQWEVLVGGTTRCPCWQRCIKTGGWVTESAELISVPGKGVPLYLCFLPHCSQLPPSLPLLLLTPPLPLYDPAVRDLPTTLHRIRMPNRSEAQWSINSLNYL